MRIIVTKDKNIPKTNVTFDGSTLMYRLNDIKKAIRPVELVPLDIALDEINEPINIQDMSDSSKWGVERIELPKYARSKIKFSEDDMNDFPNNEPDLNGYISHDKVNKIVHHVYSKDVICTKYFEFSSGIIIGVNKDNQVGCFYIKGLDLKKVIQQGMKGIDI